MKLQFKKVCKSSEIQNGQIKNMLVKDKNVLLANIDNTIFATSGQCTHEKVDLENAKSTNVIHKKCCIIFSVMFLYTEKNYKPVWNFAYYLSRNSDLSLGASLNNGNHLFLIPWAHHRSNKKCCVFFLFNKFRFKCLIPPKHYPSHTLS